MSHMVIYRGTDGKPGYHQTDDIHDAVGYVEELRNDQGVDHARIFRLEEVTFEYKPYYRVELATATTAIGSAPIADDGDDDTVEAEATEVTEVEAETDESVEDEIDDDAEMYDDADESSNGDETVSSGTARRGLFGR